MPGISVCNVDTAGRGLLLPGAQSKVFYKGNPVAVVGTRVAPHPEGHLNETMVEGSAIVNIMGVPVVFAGCKASCGHEATGRPDFTTVG